MCCLLHPNVFEVNKVFSDIVCIYCTMSDYEYSGMIIIRTSTASLDLSSPPITLIRILLSILIEIYGYIIIPDVCPLEPTNQAGLSSQLPGKRGAEENSWVH